MKISLIRHTSVYNPHNICYGQQEIALAQSFESDAQTIIHYTNSISHCKIFSSPLQRCSQLAKRCFPNHVIEYDNRLLEMNFGLWEGKSWTEIEDASREFYETFTPDKKFPQGESFMDVYTRVANFFIDIYKATDFSHAVIFSHGGTIRAGISILQNLPPEQACMMPLEYGHIFSISQ